MKIKDRFDSVYGNKRPLITQKAGYMLLLSLVFLILAVLLLIIDHKTIKTIEFAVYIFIGSGLVLIFLLMDNMVFAQIVFWLICMRELPYIIEKQTPDLIVLPVICAILFVLLLVSTTRLETMLIALFGILSVGYRIYLNLFILNLNNQEITDVLFAYLCLLSISVCLFFVSRIIKKNAINRELFIEEQNLVIKTYDRLQNLEDEIEQIKDKLYIDELTGIFNRNAFNNFYKKERSRSKRSGNVLTLTFIDLDQLKYVNDNFGHSTGDSYLKEMASVIKGSIRINDMTFRIGGDEFIILFTNCSTKQADKILLRISELFADRSNIISKTFKGSFSHGSVDTLRHGELSDDDFINKADEIMFTKKQKNEVIRGAKYEKRDNINHE